MFEETQIMTRQSCLGMWCGQWRRHLQGGMRVSEVSEVGVRAGATKETTKEI